MDGSWGIYVHLPFCRYRCPYCAFVVDARPAPPHREYTGAVLEQWSALAPLFAAEGLADTLYFGGGTPSRTPPEEVERLVRAFPLRPGAEVSMEANPEDCDGRLADYRAAGINRLSIGVQSFSEQTGGRLGRRRGSRAAAAAVREAQRTGFDSISVDLIFGGPGQTGEGLWADIAEAVALGVDHLSLYGLTQEEGTAFGRLGERLVRDMGAADEDQWSELYAGAVTRLEEAGLRRYEVSNFARPGHRSVHNRHYWLANPWAGLGAGAHGFLRSGQRTVNPDTVDGYLRRPAADIGPIQDPLLGWDLLWSGLRIVEGLDRARYRRMCGRRLVVPGALLQHRLVWETDERIGLSDAGFPIADSIAKALWAASIL